MFGFALKYRPSLSERDKSLPDWFIQAGVRCYDHPGYGCRKKPQREKEDFF